MLVAIICGFAIGESPINAIQMLWLNVIMDSFASLALATQPPTKDLLKRHPTKKNEKIITEFMWRFIIIQVLCQFVVLMVILFYGDRWLGVPSGIGHVHDWTPETGVHFTFFFSVFVYLQMFNFINARVLKKSEKNPFVRLCDNWIFWVIVILTFVGQIVFVEAFGAPVRCTHLTIQQHIISILIGVLSLIFGFLAKILPDNCLPVPRFMKENDDDEKRFELESFLKKKNI